MHLPPFVKGCFLMFSQLLGKYGKRVLVPSILALSGILYLLLQPNEPAGQPVAQIQPILEQPIEINQQPESVAEPSKEIFVDVKGAVRYPGVYQLTAEQRVIDAIEVAGGLTEEANALHLNYAQKLQDEMAIYVPRVGEEIPEIMGINSSKNDTESRLINLNTASESELMTLPGIGPAKAQAILVYREEKGPFKTIDELKNISGIGDKTFEKFHHLITVQ